MKVRLDSTIDTEPIIEVGDIVYKEAYCFMLISIDPITLMNLDYKRSNESCLSKNVFSSWEELYNWIADYNYTIFSRYDYDLQIVRRRDK